MAFTERVTQLDEEELEALTRAATWYANYFAREIAAEASATMPTRSRSDGRISR